MEKLLGESVSNLVEQPASYEEVETMVASKKFASDLESMIEIGILQDYLEILGKMEDN